MIESFKRRPLLSILQLVSAVIMFPAFFSVVSFFVAETPQQAARLGHPLPKGMSAGVMNHGKHYPWWTITQRPWFFALSAAVLATALIILYSTMYFDWKDKKANNDLQLTK